MTASIDNDEATVMAIVAQAPTVTEEQVRTVLTAWNAVKRGAGLGTVCQNPKGGAMGLRVCEDGVHLWLITELDGTQRKDMAPTLPGWTVLKEGVTPKENGE